MGDFFSSKFITDLKNGQLPPVDVQLSTKSLVELSVMLFITAVAIIITAQIFKRL